jgi:Iron/zinc purple acid phosphatase-like protein C
VKRKMHSRSAHVASHVSSNVAWYLPPFEISQIIVMPMPSSLLDELNPRLMMEGMEPLFRQHGVNLVVSGHNHAYVRTKSLRGGNENNSTAVDPSERSPVYLTVGTGGDSHAGRPIRRQPEAWVAARDRSTYGAGRLRVVNATHAFWDRLLIDDDDEEQKRGGEYDDDEEEAGEEDGGGYNNGGDYYPSIHHGDDDDDIESVDGGKSENINTLRDAVWFVNHHAPS